MYHYPFLLHCLLIPAKIIYDVDLFQQSNPHYSQTLYCYVTKEWTIVRNREKNNCNIFQLHLILFVVYNYVERK